MAKKTTKSTGGRKVIYPEPDVEKYMGDEAMTPAKAKELMGWIAETDYLKEKHGKEVTQEILKDSEHKFGDDYFFMDYEGEKCRATQNIHNRPITDSWAFQLAYEILGKRWKLNGETIVIGKTGIVLSGQHRLVALILAEQIWTNGKDANGDVTKQWKKNWPDGPRMETFVAVGIDEGNETTNTLDNVKPRTLSDVIFADHQNFGDKTATERKWLAKAVDFSIRLLWERTDAKVANPHAPYKSHPAALDFLARHSSVKNAVLHIMEEDKEERISDYISPGYASALLYLFGASDSEPEVYEATDPRTERKLNWTQWGKAEEFWTMFGTSPEFRKVREAISGSDGSRGAKMAILCKAWNLFKEGKKLTADKLNVEYESKDNSDVMKLVDGAKVYGIDYGPAYARPKRSKPEEEVAVVEDPTEDAVEEVSDEPPEEIKRARRRKTVEEEVELEEPVEEEEAVLEEVE